MFAMCTVEIKRRTAFKSGCSLFFRIYVGNTSALKCGRARARSDYFSGIANIKKRPLNPCPGNFL